MNLARIFQSGNSQAVRLPKEFRFDVDEVEIYRRGDEVVLRPVAQGCERIFDALAALPADLVAELEAAKRDDPPPQEREAL
ncbi:MAG: hypothetical protein RL375_812 [Pseudomonadota bacterium]